MKSTEEWLGENLPGNGGRRWWLFPSRARPRWMLPGEPAVWKAAMGLVHRRSVRFALGVLLRLFRRVRRRPDRLAGNPAPIDSVFSRIWDERPIHLAIYFGTDSVFAKDTLQCLDSQGRVLGYAKIPKGSAAVESIQYEAAILRRLRQVHGTADFFPELLHEEEGLMVQSAPPGDSGRTLDLWEDAVRLVAKIQSTRAELLAWEASPLREAVRWRAGELFGSWGETVSRGLELLDRRFEGHSVSHVFSHGDLVPWNLRRIPSGAFAFDWEWAALRLPFADLFHFLWFPLLHRPRRVIDGADLWREWRDRVSLEPPMPMGMEPVDPLDPAWALAYVVDRFSFYSHSSLSRGDDPAAFPFIGHLRDLLHFIITLPSRPQS